MSDIIYTPPASGGSGITINPTDTAVPVRLNSTTFVDSGIFNNTGGGISFPQLNSDLLTNIISIGDVTSNYSSLLFSVDRTSNLIYSQINGSQIGFLLDLNNIYCALGDFNANVNGTSFFVDDANRVIKTNNAGNDIGLLLHFQTNEFFLGDYNGINNQTIIYIKDNSKAIQLFTKNGDIVFNCDQLIYSGALTTVSAGGPSPLGHLQVTINGTPCVIQLLNP